MYQLTVHEDGDAEVRRLKTKESPLDLGISLTFDSWEEVKDELKSYGFLDEVITLAEEELKETPDLQWVEV